MAEPDEVYWEDVEPPQERKKRSGFCSRCLGIALAIAILGVALLAINQYYPSIIPSVLERVRGTIAALFDGSIDVNESHIQQIHRMAAETRDFMLSKPEPPPPLGDLPPEPVLPPPPAPPANQNDQVAVASYLNALEKYQGEIKEVQENYASELAQYEALANLQQVSVSAYQDELHQWEQEHHSRVDVIRVQLLVLESEVGRDGLAWLLLQIEFYQPETNTWVTLEKFTESNASTILNSNSRLVEDPVETGVDLLFLNYTSAELMTWLGLND